MRNRQFIYCMGAISCMTLLTGPIWAVGFSTVSVIPAEPSVSDLIRTAASGWTGYADSQFLIGAEITHSGFEVYADYYFVDMDPDGIGLPYTGEWDSLNTIGYLPVGDYWLYSKTWISSDEELINELLMNPFPDIDFSNYVFQMTDQRTNSFQVIPEPGTLVLLGLGVVLIRRRN